MMCEKAGLKDQYKVSLSILFWVHHVLCNFNAKRNFFIEIFFVLSFFSYNTHPQCSFLSFHVVGNWSILKEQSQNLTVFEDIIILCTITLCTFFSILICVISVIGILKITVKHHPWLEKSSANHWKGSWCRSNCRLASNPIIGRILLASSNSGP